jgi:hypothetical protein
VPPVPAVVDVLPPFDVDGPGITAASLPPELHANATSKQGASRRKSGRENGIQGYLAELCPPAAVSVRASRS